MNESLDIKAKEVGDRLIDISAQLADKMDTWSNSPKGPESLNDTEHAGFINKENDTSGVDLVIDVQVPEATKKALVRTWGIECILDESKRERFNNISLTFSTDYAKARKLTEKYETLTREDIRSLLHDSDTKLERVVVSDMTGRDKTTQELLGQRYDLTSDELANQDLASNISGILDTVLSALENSAAAEIQ